MVTDKRTAQVLLDRHGTTYAADAGITLRNKPAALYQLLVLSMLLSARISADIAVRAARALFDAGFTTAEKMSDATWQQRVDALGEGGYRRYDERTSTMLGEGAALLQEHWRGDLRRMRDDAESTQDIRAGLQQFPGIGPTGADIFCREVQGIWPELAPYLDTKTLDGAERLGLPTTPGRLARLVSDDDLPALAAACVRAALSREVVDDVHEQIA
ncbi:MAG TPA: endonuclease [Beutenbergiaceae bacterium]|nr:endonuclease [Beutenbergiaceae bacterium]